MRHQLLIPTAPWIALAMLAAAALAAWFVWRARRSRAAGVRLERRRVVCAPRGVHDRGLVDLACALAGRREHVALTLARSPEVILRHAVRRAGELLLISAEPRPHGPLFDEEIARVVRGARCAVAIYLPRGERELRRVLVPVHGSPDDAAAVAAAARIQAASRCAITLVYRARGRSRDPLARARGLLATAGATGAVELASGPVEGPAEHALACAHEHDLVIVGAGRKGEASPGRLGFFRERLVRRCPVSVLVVMTGGATAAPAALPVRP